LLPDGQPEAGERVVWRVGHREARFLVSLRRIMSFARRRQARSGMRDVLRAQEQKFFASFFQKRRPSFLTPPACR
jgi:hypothetical protein